MPCSVVKYFNMKHRKLFFAVLIFFFLIVGTAMPQKAYAAGQLGAPVLVSAENTSSGITVTWQSVSGAKGYRIYRRTDSGSWTRLATLSASALTYKDTNVESGVTYTYTVRAKGADGVYGLHDKKGISCLRLEGPVIDSVAACATGVKIKWSPQAGADSYRIYRKVPGGKYSTIAKSVTGTSYTDTTAVSGTTYIYAVRSKNGSFYGLFTTATYTYLAQPELISASNATSGITVKWGEVSGAASYRVYRKVEGGSWKCLATVTGNSYSDTTASGGTQYIYTVRAKAKDGSLSYTNTTGVSCIRLTNPVLLTPTVTDTSATIKWESVPGAEKYRVYRKTAGGSWSKLADTTKLSYKDTFAEGSVYYYTVRAFSGSDFSYFDKKGVSSLNIPARVVELAKSYMGTTSSKPFVDIYNTQKNPPRGSYASYSDPWCACFVSAIAIKLGITDIMPTELSCGYMIERYKALGCWVENDAYVPSPGDVIFYCWDDNGYGDCTEWPGHVGIVEKVVDGYIYVIEGNKSDAVGRRIIEINGQYIRGFGRPKY